VFVVQLEKYMILLNNFRTILLTETWYRLRKKIKASNLQGSIYLELRDVISFAVKVVQINHWRIVMNKTRNNDQSYV
jgi:hypothetical protein